jgi:hypothetical protein
MTIKHNCIDIYNGFRQGELVETTGGRFGTMAVARLDTNLTNDSERHP